MSMSILRVLQYLLLLLGSFFAQTLPLAHAWAQSSTNIEFKNNGQIVRALPLDDLRAIVPVASIKVFEVHEKAERIYHALPARHVFDKVFGRDWEKAQEIIFTSIDGYQPGIAVVKLLAHDTYFAFAHADGTRFTLTNRLQNNEIVQLGPLLPRRPVSGRIPPPITPFGRLRLSAY